jgi:hypothetical protein
MTKRLVAELVPFAIAIGMPWVVLSQDPPAAPAAQKERPKRPPRNGVSTPGVRREMTAITPAAVFPVPGTPDWQVVTEDAVWVSNAPKGTVHRLDIKTNTVAATIECGIPGTGGELAFGNGHVWATVFQVPLTEIDPATNAVVRQWFGAGGDAVRVGHGSVWLSNLREQNVWRIDLKAL